VVHALGSQPPWWQIFALAFPSAAAMALVSWHAVERPMLKLKDVPLSGMWPRLGMAAILLFSASAIVFGISGEFIGLCLLPAALALTGRQALSLILSGPRLVRNRFHGKSLRQILR